MSITKQTTDSDTRSLQGTFFGTLAKVLSLEHEDLANRQLAGLLMKLALDATDDVLRENKARRWLKLPDAVRKEIKQLVCDCDRG